MNHDVRLGVYGVSYRWRRPGSGSGREMVLEEVSFELSAGEIVALLGPNGSGKSTLLKIMSGVLPLSLPGCSGQVKYRGLDFLSLPPDRRAQNIVYVAADLKAEFPLTVEETVLLGRTCQSTSQGIRWITRVSQEDRKMVHLAMEQCLCLHLRHRYLESLSGGERQLVALARALAQGAKVLLLDEVLSRMDLNHQAEIGRLLMNLAHQGYIVILVSHDVNLATEWANTAIFLKSGRKIYHGPLMEVMTQEKIEKLYPHSHLVVGSNPMTGAPKIFFGKS